MKTIDDCGLRKQIKYVKDNITLKKELGKETSFEESLVKEWGRYLPGGDKYFLWLRHSFAARMSN